MTATPPAVPAPGAGDEVRALRRMLETATVRLEILRDRMAGCDGLSDTERRQQRGHALSRMEVEFWIEEQRALAARPAPVGAPEALAQRFHEAYERLAPSFGYETRKASAKPWSEVPENNRRLMTAVCAEILAASSPGRAAGGEGDAGVREVMRLYDAWQAIEQAPGPHPTEPGGMPWLDRAKASSEAFWSAFHTLRALVSRPASAGAPDVGSGPDVYPGQSFVVAAMYALVAGIITTEQAEAIKQAGRAASPVGEGDAGLRPLVDALVADLTAQGAALDSLDRLRDYLAAPRRTEGGNDGR